MTNVIEFESHLYDYPDSISGPIKLVRTGNSSCQVRVRIVGRKSSKKHPTQPGLASSGIDFPPNYYQDIEWKEGDADEKEITLSQITPNLANPGAKLATLRLQPVDNCTVGAIHEAKLIIYDTHFTPPSINIGESRNFFSMPTQGTTAINELLAHLSPKVAKEVWMLAFLITQSNIIDALINLQTHGIPVHIICCATQIDKSRKYMQQLFAAGVDCIYSCSTVKNASTVTGYSYLHNKDLMVDCVSDTSTTAFFFTGSANFTQDGFFGEGGHTLTFYSNEARGLFLADFQTYKQHGLTNLAFFNTEFQR